MDTTNYNELIMKQLDRLEAKVDALRKEFVTLDSFGPQIKLLEASIAQVDKDRKEDKEEMSKRIEDMEKEQVTKQDRFWLRIGQVIGVVAFVLSLFELIAHLRFLP